MFDILTDAWAHPGPAGSPAVTLDINMTTPDGAEEYISTLHKYGADSLFLTINGEYPTGTLCAVLTAMEKRFMTAYIDEKVVLAHVGWKDSEIIAYNPMLGAHTIRVAEHGEALNEDEEVVTSAHLFIKNGTVSDPKNAVNELPSYDIVLTQGNSELDLLFPDSGQILCGAYDAFYADVIEKHKGVVVGIVSSRLSSLDEEYLYWSYDMIGDFLSMDGNESYLAALVCGSDEKRLIKEGRRIFNKTLARRLDTAFCRPVSEWCGHHGLAFAGEVPYRFVGSCLRRFTLPIVTRDFSSEAYKSDTGFMSAVKCFADSARGEGFTGCAYRCTCEDTDALMKEAMLFYAGSGAIMILPEFFASPDRLSESGLEREDTKKLLRRLKRLSALGMSCKGSGSCAVLFEDGFIPFAGAEKLLCGGYDFSFVPVPQLMERGHVHGNELLIDKFRYDTVLIEPRVRLSPMEIKKVGEVPVNGGEMYRGASFVEYMKKHAESRLVRGTKGESLVCYETVKSGVPFRFILNTGDVPLEAAVPSAGEGSAYLLDLDSGKARQLKYGDADKCFYSRIRLMPWECAVIAVNNAVQQSNDVSESVSVCEIVSLKVGENRVSIDHDNITSAIIELDSISREPVCVSVNGRTAGRIAFAPYSLDITEFISKEDTVVLSGSPKGASIRFTL